MKLLIDNTRILATALDNYQGEMTAIDAPADFDSTALERYEIVGGQVRLKLPQTVSRFQARAALYNAGLLEQIETIMQSAETPVLARLAWQDALEFHRDSPTVSAMATALELTDTQVDDLFIQAAQTKA